MLARDPVAHRAHAAGVGVDVAAERPRQLAGVDRVAQADSGEVLIQLAQGDAGLDDDDVVVAVEAQHARSSREKRHDEPARRPASLPPERPVPEPAERSGSGGARRVGAICRDLVRRARPHDRHGTRARADEATRRAGRRR